MFTLTDKSWQSLIYIYLFVCGSHEILSVLSNCITQVVMCHVVTNNIVPQVGKFYKSRKSSELKVRLDLIITTKLILNKTED